MKNIPNIFLKLRKEGLLDYYMFLFIEIIENKCYMINILKIILVSILYTFYDEYIRVFNSKYYYYIKTVCLLILTYINIDNNINSNNNNSKYCSLILNNYNEIIKLSMFYTIKNSFNNLSIGISFIISEYLTMILIFLFNTEHSNLVYTKNIFNLIYLVLVIYNIIIYLKYCYKKNYKYLFLINSLILLQLLNYFILTTYSFIFNYNINDDNYSYKFNIYSLLFKLSNNLVLFTYWIIILVALNIAFYLLSLKFNIKKTIYRKLFHFLAILIYYPAIYNVIVNELHSQNTYSYNNNLNIHAWFNNQLDTDFLISISILVSFLFIIIEIFRNLTTKLKFVSKFLVKNIDNRDDKDFILTHNFLLIGFFIPLLLTKISYKLYSTYMLQDLLNIKLAILYYSGLVSLGIHDSFASIFGCTIGKTKIYPPTNKTLEGSLFGILISFIFYYYIIYFTIGYYCNNIACLKCKFI